MAETLAISQCGSLKLIIALFFFAHLSHSGEHLYLFGSYLNSDKAWRSQICKENLKCKNNSFDSLCLLVFMFRSNDHSCLSAGCDRRVFKETQLCLALLYSLLSQYRLREAQEFGDHMARLVLHRAGHQKSILTCASAFQLDY